MALTKLNNWEVKIEESNFYPGQFVTTSGVVSWFDPADNDHILVGVCMTCSDFPSASETWVFSSDSVTPQWIIRNGHLYDTNYLQHVARCHNLKHETCPALLKIWKLRPESRPMCNDICL